MALDEEETSRFGHSLALNQTKKPWPESLVMGCCVAARADELGRTAEDALAASKTLGQTEFTCQMILLLISRRWQGFRRKKMWPQRAEADTHKVFDPVCRFSVETFAGNPLCFRVFDLRDSPTHTRNGGRRHAVGGRAEADE